MPQDKNKPLRNPRFCVNCVYAQEVFGTGPQGQMFKNLVCTNGFCGDPVTGESIPCALSRRESAFCGIEGRFYEKKEAQPEPEKAPLLELVKS